MSKMSSRRRISLSTFLSALLPALFFALCHVSAFADPPGRVGRVSFLGGTVAFFAGDEEGWRPALINFPVTSENSLWTEANGRAEVRIGATAVRLEQNSVLDFQRVTDDNTLIFLQRGAVNLRIREFNRGDIYLVATPEGKIFLRAAGRYRVDADDERNESRITVFSGRARIDANGGATTVDAGTTLVLHSAGAGAAPRMTFEPIAETDFDNWAATRDEGQDHRVASRYLSPAMTGHEELDGHGEWVDVPEYGNVWYPRTVEREWAPYRDGRWTWVRPWGWTWVDNAAWGFAPFHYGRWVYLRGRWGWWPGAYVARPIYAPALVAWIGSPGWNVTYSGGYGPGIGWCPLAPYEPFLPTYTTNIVYIRNINRYNGNRPLAAPSYYLNLKPGSTVVSPTTLAASAPVATNRLRVSGEAVATQPVSQSSNVLPFLRSGAATIGAPGVGGNLVGGASGGRTAVSYPKPLPSSTSQVSKPNPVAAPNAMQNATQQGNLQSPVAGGQPAVPSTSRYSAPKPTYPVPATAANPQGTTPNAAAPAPAADGRNRILGEPSGTPITSYATPANPAGQNKPARVVPTPQVYQGHVPSEPQYRAARPRSKAPPVTEEGRVIHARPGHTESAPKGVEKPQPRAPQAAHHETRPERVEKPQTTRELLNKSDGGRHPSLTPG